MVSQVTKGLTRPQVDAWKLNFSMDNGWWPWPIKPMVDGTYSIIKLSWRRLGVWVNLATTEHFYLKFVFLLVLLPFTVPTFSQYHWPFLSKTRSSPLNPEDIRLSPPIVMWPNLFPALILHRYESLDCYPCVLLHRDGAIVGLSVRRLQCCSQDTRLLIEKLRLGVLLGPVYVEKVSARPSGTHYLCKPTKGPALLWSAY